MKVIFLDIDGVLNTARTFRRQHKIWKETGERGLEIDEFRVFYLQKIVEQTGAIIVLSSSWRNFLLKKNGKLISKHLKMDAFLELLQQYGLELFDVTGVSRTGMRQEEIYDWLRGRHDVESFVVLDDDSYDLSCFVGRELVKTSFSLDGEMIFDMEVCSGLCQEHVVQAVSILNKEKVRQKER